MLHDQGGVACGSGAADALSVDDGDTSSVLVGVVTVCDFVAVWCGEVYVGSWCRGEPGFHEEEDVGVRVLMRSQISVACLQREHMLRRRQLSCYEAGVSCLVCVVVVAVRVGVPVLQAKEQCRLENGATVVQGVVWQQLVLWCPGSRWSSSAVV